MEVWVGKGRKGDSDVVHREDDTQLLAGERGLQRGRVEESPAANDGEEEAVEVLVDAALDDADDRADVPHVALGDGARENDLEEVEGLFGETRAVGVGIAGHVEDGAVQRVELTVSESLQTHRVTLLHRRVALAELLENLRRRRSPKSPSRSAAAIPAGYTSSARWLSASSRAPPAARSSTGTCRGSCGPAAAAARRRRVRRPPYR